jgi:predicted outer membrane repeat protein
MPKWFLYAALFHIGLFLSACTPPNTPPVLSQPGALSFIHNTLAAPQQATVTFAIRDAEDTPENLTLRVSASDPVLVQVANPTCDSAGSCTLNLTVVTTTPVSTSVTLTLQDTKAALASSTFTVTVAPEEKTVNSGAELKGLLESSPAGASLKLMNTAPVLLTTQIILDKELTLWGLGLEQTTLDSQSLDRHFWIKPTANVTLRDLTLTNGNAQDAGSTLEGDKAGGSIFSEGVLVLQRARIINSKALDGVGTSKGKGGAIYTFTTGSTSILESVIGQENNANVATNSGGGLFNDGGKLTLSQSQVSFNEGQLRGGGIFNYRSGELLVESSTIFSNVSEDGTAVKNEEGLVVIRSSTLEKNIGSRLEGGAIVNLRGNMEIYSSVLRDNTTLIGSGGAIYNGATATLRLDDTLLENNRAARAGGAIYNEVGSGLLELTNGTKLLSNSATEHGGGIYNAGTLKISANCEISSNTANTSTSTFVGGGIFNAGAFADTSDVVLGQVVTNNQPDNVYTPPTLLAPYYKTLYQTR